MQSSSNNDALLRRRTIGVRACQSSVRLCIQLLLPVTASSISAVIDAARSGPFAPSEYQIAFTLGAGRLALHAAAHTR
ncbi:hypothetical protein TgHK011_005823 [Trichoderma gracile]|nr:hypothetical protein TgHK011_005823 [Trichoderma gracile]